MPSCDLAMRLVVLAEFAAAVRPRLTGLHHLLAPVELVIAHRILLGGGRAQLGHDKGQALCMCVREDAVVAAVGSWVW